MHILPISNSLTYCWVGGDLLQLGLSQRNRLVDHRHWFIGSSRPCTQTTRSRPAQTSRFLEFHNTGHSVTSCTRTYNYWVTMTTIVTVRTERWQHLLVCLAADTECPIQIHWALHNIPRIFFFEPKYYNVSQIVLTYIVLINLTIKLFHLHVSLIQLYCALYSLT